VKVFNEKEKASLKDVEVVKKKELAN